jgi:hypothetical protein
MNRLYKFFAILFCVFLLISFIYGTVISWISFEVMTPTLLRLIDLGDNSPAPFLQAGLIIGSIYALVLLLMVIFLFNRAFQNGQKFTVRNIITVTVWFFIVTTGIYAIHYFSTNFYTGGPHPLWLPFLLAWGILFIVFMDKIKKAV